MRFLIKTMPIEEKVFLQLQSKDTNINVKKEKFGINVTTCVKRGKWKTKIREKKTLFI
jgi:hypothetical protein